MGLGTPTWTSQYSMSTLYSCTVLTSAIGGICWLQRWGTWSQKQNHKKELKGSTWILSHNIASSTIQKDTHYTAATHHYDQSELLYRLVLPPHLSVAHWLLDLVLCCPSLWYCVCSVAISLCNQLFCTHAYIRRATPKINFPYNYKTQISVS